MNVISNLMIPLLVLVVVFYGIFKKVSVYDVFTSGAKESFSMVFSLFPCLLGMVLSVNLLLNSGILDKLLFLLKPLLNLIHFPIELFPMAVMRSVSGSTTLAIMNNFFVKYGPDSFIGRLASVIQSSSDTTFYILTLYFGSVGIKKTRHALKAGLLADLIGVISGVLVTRLFFS